YKRRFSPEEATMVQEKGTLLEHSSSSGLDVGVLTRSVLVPLIIWCVWVGGATSDGYPGVVCLTPMAWLLGRWSGNFCAARSGSQAQRRLLEAGIAGALLGLLQGVIFYVIQRAFMPVKPDEVQNALVLSLGIIGFGTIISALLSLGTAALRNRRRGA